MYNPKHICHHNYHIQISFVYIISLLVEKIKFFTVDWLAASVVLSAYDRLPFVGTIHHQIIVFF